LTSESIYTYFIDNQQTSGHQSIIFGLRELNSTETLDVCSITSINISPPITNQRSNFTSNYELRVYTSGCYYLDTNNNWQSDGLVVSLVLFCLLRCYKECHAPYVTEQEKDNPSWDMNHIPSSIRADILS
jgi:hypothetical protein